MTFVLLDKSVTDTKVPARIVGWGTLYDKVIVKVIFREAMI